jgi:predicted SnoaL-like aldol condensation-catalyzing enzyme
MRTLFIIVFGLMSTGIYTLKKQHDMTNSEIVEKFLDGFNNPTKIQQSIDLLAEDYQFKNPLTETHSKAAFVTLAQQIGAVLTGINIIQIAENGVWVAAYYEFKSALPGLESNIAAEWFRLENGKIQESRLIYDASEWRKVYAQMEGR